MKTNKFIILTILACIAFSTLNVSVQAFLVPSTLETTTTTTQVPEDMIRDTAKLITARIYAVDPQGWQNGTLETIPISGSGILVDRMEIKQKNNESVYRYLVFTNRHISSVRKIFYIQTHDGLIHRGLVHPTAEFEQNTIKADLGLLRFDSPYIYEKAMIGESTK